MEHKARPNAEQTPAGGVPGYFHVQVSGTAEQKSAHSTDAVTAAQLPPTDTAQSTSRRSLGGGGLPNQINSGELRGNSKALDASTPRPNVPNRNNQQDVGNIARKWGLKFTGEKGQSIDVFLNRVEEYRDLAKMSEEEMLSSLSELFAGVAATWYQNNNANWSTWSEFCVSARKWYGANRRFQQRILQEVTARKQGREEPVRDFITCLLSIL